MEANRTGGADEDLTTSEDGLGAFARNRPEIVSVTLFERSWRRRPKGGCSEEMTCSIIAVLLALVSSVVFAKEEAAS